MAQLQFLPWVSAGAAASVPRKAGGVNRVPLDVTVAVTSSGGAPVPASAASAAPPLSLLGPGDVTGVPAAHRVRTEPQDGAAGVETTLFPCVEFDHAALPWLFTPASPAGAQVTPWLCLIVVAAQDGVQLDAAAGRLTIAPPADPAKELPDLAEAWSWAHAQYAGDFPADTATGTVSGRSAADAMADPAAALSRLVCPRVLQPGTSYYGCVVPATSVGQVAGLGGTPADDAPVRYAWPAQDASQAVTLPVYYSFQFSTATGEAGDFKALATRLAHPPGAPPPAAGPLGQRSLRVSWTDPGGGNPASETVAMPAILSVPAPPASAVGPAESPAAAQRPVGSPQPGPAPGGPEPGPGPGGPPPPTPDPVYPTAGSWLTAQFTPDLAAPHLTVPLYGAVQAGVTSAQAAAGGLALWLAEVSADPRLRVAAALGAQVVTADREDLVASAFSQLGDIKPVNAHFARAQLARAAGDRHVTRHLAGHDDLSTLQLLSPLAARLAASVVPDAGPAMAGSAYSIVQASSEPSLSAVCSAAYRRVSRPRGPHARAVPAPAPPPSPITAAALLTQLGAVGGAVAHRVRSDYVTPPTLTQAAGNDPLRAVAPAVEFRTPMIGPLAACAPDAVLSGAGSIPVNTALTLQDNPDVIAA